ncbi:MAG: helix-turn-helix transcriptional regulator [Clostridia bacterium]|nr:helix-turn-helix transcriptional regulator [Clostridia bacterium]
MENTSEINEKIARNLAYYRKAAKLTQAELAEKINYSDKSVSKWESGNGVPDVYILMQLAQLYGITLNDLVCEEPKSKITRMNTAGLHLLILLLSVGIVWLVAVCAFVGLHLLRPSGEWWIAFVYAAGITSIVIIVYAGIWHYRTLNFIGVTALIWLSILSIYLTAKYISLDIGTDPSALWILFLLGVPLQVLEVLWSFFRYLFKKRNVALDKPKKRKESKKNR